MYANGYIERMRARASKVTVNMHSRVHKSFASKLSYTCAYNYYDYNYKYAEMWNCRHSKQVEGKIWTQSKKMKNDRTNSKIANIDLM